MSLASTALATLDPVKYVHGEVLPPDVGGVNVSTAPNPFKTDQVFKTVPAGLSIIEILELVQPNPALCRHAHVFINGHFIPKENWTKVRPKEGTHVNIRVVPTGGNGGGGKALRLVLMIVILVAAAYIAPELAPYLLSTFGTVGSATVATSLAFYTTIAAGLITVAGNLLVNALVPAATPKTPSISGSAASSSDSPTLSISGARNSFRPFQPVPRILGKHLHVPPYGANPFTEVLGDDQYLRMLLCWGYGPITLESESIGTTAIGEFDAVEREFRRGYQPSQINNRGNWDASTAAFPTSPVFGDKYTISVAGTISGTSYAVGDVIIYSGVSDPWANDGWDLNGDQPLKLYPESVHEDAEQILLTNAIGWQVRSTQPDCDEISLDFTFPNGLVEFDAQANKQSLSVSLSIQYAVKGTGAWVSRPDVTVTDARTASIRAGDRWTVSHGQYDVRVQRVTGDRSSSQIVDQVFWTILRSFTARDPINLSGLCLESIRIKATDQLQGVIDQYQGINQSILLDYDSGSNSWIIRPTSSPPAMYREVLEGAANARAVPSSRVDIAQMELWDTFCRANGFEFNMVRDFLSTVDDTLKDIASAGRAFRTKNGTLWSVGIDEPQDVYVQHITQRNCSSFSGNKQFLDIPEGIRVQFPNRENNWDSDQRLVFQDGFDETNATKYVTMDFPGITDPQHIWKSGRYYLANMQLRPETYEVVLDFEYLIAKRGQLVSFTHDAMAVGISSGRIESLVVDGSDNIVQMLSDTELGMEFGKVYGVVVRTYSSGVLTRVASQIVTDPTNTTLVTFVTPLSPDSIKEGNLFSFGEFGEETIDAIIKEIAPQNELSAKLVLVDHSPAIYTADTGTIPVFDSHVTAPFDTSYPSITGLRSDESVLIVNPDKSWFAQIAVSFNFSGRRPTTVNNIQLRYRPTGTTGAYQYVTGAAQASELYIQGAQTGTSYDIQSRYLLKDGSSGKWGPVAVHIVVGPGNPPPDIVYVYEEEDTIRWPYTPPPDFAGFRIKRAPGDVNIDWEHGFDVLNGQLLAHPEFDMNTIPHGPQTVMVKAVDLAGNESVGFARVVANLGTQEIFSAIHTENYQDASWPGTITGGAVDVPSNHIKATDDGTLYLPTNTDLYLPNDADLYLPTTNQQLEYFPIYTVDTAILPGTMKLDTAISGIYNIEYRKSGDTVWLNWPGSVNVDAAATAYEFHITCRGGSVQGVISTFNVVVDGEIQTEDLSNIAIASGGTRLVLTKTYRTINIIHITLLDDAGTAITAKAMDHDESLGPLIKCFDASGTAVAGHVYVSIQGVKG